MTCACGNSFEVGATVPEMKLEICSACHPFFTGGQKLIDTAGRVDRYRARLEKAEKLKAKRGKIAPARKPVKKLKVEIANDRFAQTGKPDQVLSS